GCAFAMDVGRAGTCSEPTPHETVTIRTVQSPMKKPQRLIGVRPLPPRISLESCGPWRANEPRLLAHCPNNLVRRRVLQEVAQLRGARAVAQLAQRLRLDLADALAGDAELAAHLLQRALAPVVQPEAELQHAPLAARQRVQHVLDLLLEELVRGGV